jgi:hypothetical protein
LSDVKKKVKKGVYAQEAVVVVVVVSIQPIQPQPSLSIINHESPQKNPIRSDPKSRSIASQQANLKLKPKTKKPKKKKKTENASLLPSLK